MKKVLFYFLICFFVFGGGVITNYKPASIKATTKEELEIYQDNFFDDFYNNENLLGEEGKNYIVKIAEDINLEEVFKKKPPFNPIGAEANPFTAEIEGNYKSLLNFSSPFNQNNLAFFGYFSGVVKNLKIINFNISSNANSATLAITAKDAVFENIIIDGCSLWGFNTAGISLIAENVNFYNIVIKVGYYCGDEGHNYAVVHSFDSATRAENVCYAPINDEANLFDNGFLIINDSEFNEEDFINAFNNVINSEVEDENYEPLDVKEDELENNDDEMVEEIIFNKNNSNSLDNNGLVFKIISLLNRMPFLRVAMFVTPLLLCNMCR